MDTIKFIIGDAYDTHITAKAVSVELYLNDTKIQHSCLNVPQILAAHKFKLSQFDLYTCSCGEPGCAGFSDEVLQVRNDRTTLWKFPEDGGYNTDKKKYEFENEQFLQQFQQLFSNLVDLEKANIYHEVLIPLDYGEHQSGLEIPEKIYLSVDYYTKVFQADENNLELLASYPHLFGNFFTVNYNGAIGKNYYSFPDIVGRILNQYSGYNNEKYYLKKCKLTIKAIEQALGGNNALLQKIVKNVYNKVNDSIFWIVDQEFSNINKDNFELSKLSIVKKE